MKSTTKKAKKHPRLNHLAEREALGLNQSQYWNPLGVTQSSGSRYETGRKVPKPVEQLAILRKQGVAIPEVA